MKNVLFKFLIFAVVLGVLFVTLTAQVETGDSKNAYRVRGKNVNISGIGDGSILQYDNSAGEWIIGSAVSGGTAYADSVNGTAFRLDVDDIYTSTGENKVGVNGGTITDATLGSDLDGDGNYLVDTQVPRADKGPVYWFDGSDDCVVFSDDSDLDFGTGDFTIRITIIPENVSRTTDYIINKESGGVGWGLYLNQDDLYIRFDDNSTDATAIIGTACFENDVEARIVVRFDRDGNATAWVNEDSVGVVDISSTTSTISNAGDLHIGNDSAGGNEFLGHIGEWALFNNAISSTSEPDVAILNGDDIPNKYLEASQTALYTSDFSTDEDGFTATGGAVAGNIDGIGGQNDNLRFTLNSASGSHYISQDFSCVIGESYIVSMDYYLPSTNSNMDGFKVYNGSAYLSTQTATDSWTTYTFTTTMMSATLVIQGVDGPAESFQDAGGDDVIYFRNMTIKRNGCTAQVKRENMASVYCYEASGNVSAGTVYGALLINPKKQLYVEDLVICGRTLNGDGHYINNYCHAKVWCDSTITGETTISNVLPAGYGIESIIVKNTTENEITLLDIGFSDAGGEIVAAANVAANLEDDFTILKKIADFDADDTLYISADTWNSANLIIYIRMVPYF